MVTLYILRHGQTQWNAENRMQGGLDSPLTVQGRRQALKQGEILRDAGLDELPLMSSPQGRAYETARIALPDRQPIVDPRLAEVRMGEWQGKTLIEIERLWPGSLRNAHPFLWKFDAPGGETLAMMQARVDGFLESLTGPTIVVTHGVTSQLIRGRVLGLGLEAMSELTDFQGVVYQVSEADHAILGLPDNSGRPNSPA